MSGGFSICDPSLGVGRRITLTHVCNKGVVWNLLTLADEIDPSDEEDSCEDSNIIKIQLLFNIGTICISQSLVILIVNHFYTKRQANLSGLDTKEVSRMD